MGRYILRRMLLTIPALLLTTLLVFLLVRLIPGNPIAVLLEREQDPETVARLRAFYGLDKPLLQQYFVWLREIASGSFGQSFLNGADVTGIVLERFPRTLYLMTGGLIVSLLIALPAGIITAARRATWTDISLTSLATVLMAMPNFWLGILLILLFAVELGWLPAAGYVSPTDDLTESLKFMILPWITLGGSLCALTTRILRSSMLDAISRDFVRTARAKGLTERRVLLGHALKNAIIPTITVVGLQVGYLMGGAVVVERVFAYPGMGLLLINSITNRDYPVIQAGILLFAVTFIVINLVTDILYMVVDPRIRRG